MWRNYLKITLRNLLGNKLYSCINIIGLAVGLASVILLGLYVKYELSYDRQYTNAENIYRITRDIYPNDGSREQHLATSPIPMAAQLKQDFPQIEEVARMRASTVFLRRGDIAYNEDGVRFVDESFFRLFDLVWLQGDKAHAFDGPDSIVLTRSMATRYFGSEDPLGKALQQLAPVPLKITGVIEDLPQNTQLTGDAFLPMDGFLRFIPETISTSWEAANIMYTFMKVAPSADMQALTAQLPEFVSRHVNVDPTNRSSLTVMKIADIHLHSQLDKELKAPASFTTLLTLITAAVAILLIACFNFMNLTTARSMMRAREVGIRKAIGSDRAELVVQFLSESFGLAVIATLLAIVIVEVALPAFVGFTNKQIVYDLWHDHGLQALLLALVLLVGLGAGCYPAFYLASFKPIQVLSSGGGTAVGGILLRNLLVILQFAIAITLVVITAITTLQIRYMHSFDPGFNKDQVVIVSAPPTDTGLTKNWQAMKAELLRNPDILSVTASDRTPGDSNINRIDVNAEGLTQTRSLISQYVDYDFFETYDIKLLSGRLFASEFPGDVMTEPGAQAGKGSANFILNEIAARELGWTAESAIGKQFVVPFGANVTLSGHIVGIVADSNFESARLAIQPMVFMLIPGGFWEDTPAFGSASVRISGRNVSDTLATIDKTWKQFIPEFPVRRAFLSDNFAALYQDDIRLGRMFSAFAALAIVIACFGLYGLATFNTQRRIKEIGVRKVMGGSVWNIVVLLTNDFSRLVLVSNLIAWPVAYFAMNRWLESFAYRIDLTPVIFIGSGLIALCIAWVTVGGTAAKAASQKPVLALRYE